MDGVVSILAMSFAFALIGLNVYLSAKVLNILDLTCDASVAIGGCSYGVFVIFGVDPVVAFVLAGFLGIISGSITSSLITYIKVEPIFASIITLTAMQTVIAKFASVGSVKTFQILKSNIGVLSTMDNMFLIATIVILLSLIFYRIITSEYGLAMRVYGDGKIISESLGINSDKMLFVGLCLGNAFSALAGALIVQVTYSFSAGMGTGALIFGMTAIIIGDRIVSINGISTGVAGCFVGAIIYKFAIGIIMYFLCTESSGSEYNNIIMAIVLAVCLASIKENNKKHLLENF